MIHDIASVVTYGWGMIPASVTIGSTTVTTALWPKDGGYIVPIKKALQDSEGLGVARENRRTRENRRLPRSMA